MKTRIITGSIGGAALLLVSLLVPESIIAIIIGVIAAFSVFEYARATGASKYILPFIVSMLVALFIPIWAGFGKSQALIMCALMVYALAMMGWLMVKRKSVAFESAAHLMVAAIAIPFAFSALVDLVNIGRVYLLLPFVISFSSDTGAYFAGMFLGKHHATGDLSPNKTYEGMIGGIVGTCAVTAIYCVIMLLCGYSVTWLCIIVYGILGSAVSQFGDLAFSYIKRQYNIKDFGRLLPGHGGVLDRFDSIVFGAPFVLMLSLVIPLFA